VRLFMGRLFMGRRFTGALGNPPVIVTFAFASWRDEPGKGGMALGDARHFRSAGTSTPARSAPCSCFWFGRDAVR